MGVDAMAFDTLSFELCFALVLSAGGDFLADGTKCTLNALASSSMIARSLVIDDCAVALYRCSARSMG